MTLETLEQYLDGALGASEAKAVEAAMATDAVLAARVERLKAQRALRAAALSTYSPTDYESRIFAMKAIEACYEQNAQPVGRVGFGWMKKVGAVAAALVIAAVSYYAGQRSTATPTIASNETKEVFIVIQKNQGGDVVAERSFDSIQEAQDYVAKVSQETQDDMPAIDDGTLAAGVM